MRIRSRLLITTIVGTIGGTSAAYAQAAPEPISGEATAPEAAETETAPTAAQAAQGIEDIVVTARRVEESLQTTPVAVTALGSAQLERAQVVNIQDLQRTAPSLVISSGSASTSGFAFVSIRGQGNLAPLIANDPAVATYVDGVYVPRPATGLTDMHDMQRVEVLRGPQGTLFGRNTTGGALNLISQDPVDRFTGMVRGELGNFDHNEFGAVLNIPLAENLAARAVYNFREHSGYGQNAFLDRDVADIKSHFARGKLRYDGDAFDVTLAADYNRITDKGQLTTLAGFNSGMFAAGPLAPFGFAAPLAASLHDHDRWYTHFAGGVVAPFGSLAAAVFPTLPADVQALYGEVPFDKTTAYGGSATINVGLGEYKLKSITGYRYSKTRGLIDTDGSPAAVLATFGGTNSEQWSQEMQLSGDLSERLSFILGGYWSRETGFEISRSQVFAGLIRNSTGEAKNISKGLFAQLYTDITDTVRATTGFRYTWDKRITDLHNRQILGLAGDADQDPRASAPGVQFNCTNANVGAALAAGQPALAAERAAECSLVQSAKFDYPAWTVGLDWQATDTVFLYAVTRGAAKAGGWNIRAGALPAFSPEKVKDIEGGLKATWFDRRLRTNVAVFHSWKKDAQEIVNAFVPGIGVTQFIQNNGKQRVWGAEFEVTAAPWRGMEITGSLSLLDGKRKDFAEVQRITSATPLPGCSPATATQVDCPVDLSGLPLSQLPKRQINLGVTQRLPIGRGELALHGNYAYTSSQYFAPVQAAQQQPAAVQALYARQFELSRIPGYGLVNGRIGYTLDDPNIELYVFGRNLLKKEYLTRRFADLFFTGQLGFAVEYPGNPRTLGMGLKYKFGS